MERLPEVFVLLISKRFTTTGITIWSIVRRNVFSSVYTDGAHQLPDNIVLVPYVDHLRNISPFQQLNLNI